MARTLTPRLPHPLPASFLSLVDLYIVQSWSGYVGIDLTPYPGVTDFAKRVAAHPLVVEAHAEMNAAA
jgi:hypothetical protein